jgi:hypothetical protein
MRYGQIANCHDTSLPFEDELLIGFPNATVRAKERGEFGMLTITRDISKCTKASVLQSDTETENAPAVLEGRRRTRRGGCRARRARFGS